MVVLMLLKKLLQYVYKSSLQMLQTYPQSFLTY